MQANQNKTKQNGVVLSRFMVLLRMKETKSPMKTNRSRRMEQVLFHKNTT